MLQSLIYLKHVYATILRIIVRGKRALAALLVGSGAFVFLVSPSPSTRFAQSSVTQLGLCECDSATTNCLHWCGLLVVFCCLVLQHSIRRWDASHFIYCIEFRNPPGSLWEETMSLCFVFLGLARFLRSDVKYRFVCVSRQS